ncbi:MAG TPA: type IV pilin protein [Gammaproteobacteria bacterium]|nr:type IV pilin protein [Gammaproteobacteria bacterium]
MNRPDNNRGVTLLELMITVAIVGILAAIVYPTYRDQMLKTTRGTEGLATLQDLASRQERYYSKNSTYTVDPADLGFAADGMTPKGLYQIKITDDPCGDIRRCYSITASAAAGQVDDEECQTMTIDSTGSKTSAPAAAGCWR